MAQTVIFGDLSALTPSLEEYLAGMERVHENERTICISDFYGDAFTLACLNHSHGHPDPLTEALSKLDEKYRLERGTYLESLGIPRAFYPLIIVYARVIQEIVRGLNPIPIFLGYVTDSKGGLTIRCTIAVDDPLSALNIFFYNPEHLPESHTEICMAHPQGEVRLRGVSDATVLAVVRALLVEWEDLEELN